MRKIKFHLLLSLVFTAFSLLACAAPVLDYTVEDPESVHEASPEIRQAFKNAANLTSDTLTGNGTAEIPFQIATADDFLYMTRMVNAGNAAYAGAYYEQTADIDLTGTAFTPIGTKETPFSGSYDGNRYRLMWRDVSFTGDVFGVFGYALAADFRNIDIYMEAEATYEAVNEKMIYAGMLCGIYHVASGYNSTVSACSVDGTLVAKNPIGPVNLGGLFGELQANIVYYGDVLLEDVTSAADISAKAYTSPYTGGIVARASTGGRGRIGFVRCYVSGSVLADGISNKSYSAYAGGIAGCMYIDDSNWSIWTELSAETVDTDRIHTVITDCISAPKKLTAVLSQQSNNSTAYVGYLCASVSESVSVVNGYYLKNSAVKTNGENLSMTEIQMPEELYDARFLTATLSFDLDLWWLADGKALSLNAQTADVIISREDQTLRLKALGCREGNLIVAYRNEQGGPLAVEAFTVTAASGYQSSAFPLTDDPLTASVFLLGTDSLTPLIDVKHVS